MPVEDADDLAEFFDADEFGVEIEWALQNGSESVETTGQLFAPSQTTGFGAPDMIMDTPRLHVPAADLPDGFGAGDLVTFQGGALPRAFAVGDTWKVPEKPLFDESGAIVDAKLVKT